MSLFNLEESLERARRRLGDATSRTSRARRSDRGASRLDPAVLDCVREVLSGRERPRMTEILERIGEGCRKRGLAPPSRATVYKLMARLPCSTRRVADLPVPVRAALYNLSAESEVPGHQVAFYCFNHGDGRAVSFAAGLPWLAIYQALRLPGYRKKSRGLAEAVARARGI